MTSGIEFTNALGSLDGPTASLSRTNASRESRSDRSVNCRQAQRICGLYDEHTGDVANTVDHSPNRRDKFVWKRWAGSVVVRSSCQRSSSGYMLRTMSARMRASWASATCPPHAASCSSQVSSRRPSPAASGDSSMLKVSRRR